MIQARPRIKEMVSDGPPQGLDGPAQAGKGPAEAVLGMIRTESRPAIKMAVPAAVPILTHNTAGYGVFLATMGAVLITRLCSRGHWKVKPIGPRSSLTGFEAPEKDHDGQDDVRHPGADHFLAGIEAGHLCRWATPEKRQIGGGFQKLRKIPRPMMVTTAAMISGR